MMTVCEELLLRQRKLSVNQQPFLKKREAKRILLQRERVLVVVETYVNNEVFLLMDAFRLLETSFAYTVVSSVANLREPPVYSGRSIIFCLTYSKCFLPNSVLRIRISH